MRYVKFASAWNRATKNEGKQFISVSAKSKDSEFFLDKNPKTANKTTTRLFVQINDEEPMQVSNFSLFPNDIDKERYPNAPDYSVTLTLDD